MKILVFAPYYPPHVGGLENYADELNKQLSSQMSEITVFTPHLPADSPAMETRYENVKIIRFPAFEIIHSYPLPKFWSHGFRETYRALKKESFDCVVSHTRFFSTSLLAFCFAKTKKIRWVHIEHGSDFVSIRRPFNWISKFYDYTLGKLVLNKADAVVAISESVAKFIHRLAPRVMPFVIYRGFDIGEFEARRDREKKDGSFKLIFVGRLIVGKGVNYLLEALTQLKDKNFTLTLIGAGPERKNLEKLAEKLKIADKVTFLGQLSHAETISQLKNSDLFVNPSLNEGLPTTVIEAAFCRTPIIATGVGGTEEIITDGVSGFIVSPRGSNVLSQKITRIMENKELADKMATAAYFEALQKFDWKNNLPKIIGVFKGNGK